MEKGNEEDSDIFHLLAWNMREKKRGDWNISSRPLSFFLIQIKKKKKKKGEKLIKLKVKFQKFPSNFLSFHFYIVRA